MTWFKNLGTNFGLLLMRVGIGIIFIIHGIPKILGGYSTWQWLGTQMQHIGVNFFPTLWGFMAAISMAIGGVLLILGLRVRPVCAVLAFAMFVAFMMHVRQGDPFREYSHALSLLIVFIGLFFTGGGSHAIDARL